MGELCLEQSTSGTTLASFQVGAIWRVSEAIAFDAAVRLEPHSAGVLWEGRLGFTWSTP